MFNKSFFDVNVITIPEDCDVVFVADMFAEDYAGGAELTTQALIDSSPFTIFKLHSKDVNQTLLEQGHRKHWIFGNFSLYDFLRIGHCNEKKKLMLKKLVFFKSKTLTVL